MKIKREREEPCYICGHYHDYEGGEPCSICGHRLSTSEERVPVTSAFPSEIVQDFLFLGSYDNASRAELLKALGIRYILNCVPTCQVLYKNSFTYHTVSSVPPPLNECIEFIETARRENSKILVHCMSGISRSPAVVAAYLMKSRSWRLVDSMKWVKERQPSMQLTPEALQQLIEMEVSLFGSATMAPNGAPVPIPPASATGPWAAAAFGMPQPAAGGSPPAFSFGGQQQQPQQRHPQQFQFGKPGGSDGGFVFTASQGPSNDATAGGGGPNCAMDE
mmetsp:Transcript_31952/g.90741  ORF Transcript_31952/g.90741 Transcript_31952/m.90741 type:complete len:277 (-) Transcript_31952:110-940(-)